LFPKEKELATLKQLFLLHGNKPHFLHAPPLKAGPRDATLLRSLKRMLSKAFTATSTAKQSTENKAIRKGNIHSNKQSEAINRERSDSERKHPPQRAKQCCIKLPASLFGREMEEVDGAYRTKSCLSGASFFCSAETTFGIAQKVQTALFLCFVSFVRTKEMKMCAQKK